MEREIPEFDLKATCGEVLCTKCGLSTQDFRSERWVCDDVFTRVEGVFKTSQALKSWKDVMAKLSRLYCLNKYEAESGFEPDDEILERNDDYCLVKDKRGLLLIVIHNQDNQNYIDKMKDMRKASDKPRIAVVVIEGENGHDRKTGL